MIGGRIMPRGNPRRVLAIRVSERTHAELTRRADAQGVPVSVYARNVLGALAGDAHGSEQSQPSNAVRNVQALTPQSFADAMAVPIDRQRLARDEAAHRANMVARYGA